MTTKPAHKPAGTPDGGQFTSHGHSDTVPSLGPSEPVTFQGEALLSQAGYARLPELPASVGTPEVSFSFSDAGKLETHVTVGGSTVSFWTDEDDDVANTVDDGHTPEGEYAPWSNIADYEDFEKARTWAESVHERVESATTQIAESAVESDQARASIIAFATGRDVPGVKLTPEQASAKRAAAAMAVCEEGQGRDVTMRDLFTDLRHYADANGIDFYKAMEESQDYYQHEKTDPTFKEGY